MRGESCCKFVPFSRKFLTSRWFLQKTSKDDFQCVDLKNNNCWDEEKMIQDLVCKYSYSIDCGKHKPQGSNWSLSVA